MTQTLHVIRPFNLLLNDEEQRRAGATGNLVSFGLGRHEDVPDVIADHPFVQSFLGSEEEVGAALRPASPAGYRTDVPMVEQAVYDALVDHADKLRERVSDLEAATASQGSIIATLGERVGEAGRAKDEAETALKAERDAHAETRALLDQATAPKGDGAGEGIDEQDEPAVDNVSVRHKGRGLFAVFRGEEQVSEPMAKDAASARAAEMRAQG